MRALVVGSILLLLRLADCADAKATVTVGREDIVLSAASAGVPTSLRDDSGSTPVIASVACAGSCPSAGSVTVQCVGSVCDPDPVALAVPIALVDFASEASDLFQRVDAVELLALTYEVSDNTLTFTTGDVELFWGPASASSVGDPGVEPLGTFPAVAPGATPSGSATLDRNGTAALSDYVSDVSSQVRLFARSTVDFDPGDPFPDGELIVDVVIRIRIVGQLL